MMMSIGLQLVWLFVLAFPVASIAWAVTHEEIFREPREYCIEGSKNCQIWYKRKFYYLFTCEYCFSHYIAAFFIFFTNYKLLLDDWRGYLIAIFAVVWVANQYMSIYNRLRLDIKRERVEIGIKEQVADKMEELPPEKLQQVA